MTTSDADLPGSPGAAPWTPRLAGALLLFAVGLLAAIELFQGALLAGPPEGFEPHGVLASPRHVRMAAVYGGFAREAAEGGGLRAHNHHTVVPHEPLLVRPKEWVVGRTMALLGIDPVQALRVERVYAVGIFTAGLGLLGSTVLVRRRSLWVLLVAAATGGTLYWMPSLVPGLADRPELWRAWLGGAATRGADSGLGYSLSGMAIGGPHLLGEVGWFATALAFAIRGARARRARWTLLAGIAVLALGSTRPYTLPVVLTACGCAELPNLFAAGRRAGAVARVGLLSLPVAPLVVHIASVVTGDTIFSSLDVLHLAPDTHELLLFLGLPALLLPLVGFLLWRRGARPRWTVATCAMLGWAAIQLAIVNGAPLIAWEVEPLMPLYLLVLLGTIAGLERLAAGPRLLTCFLALHAVGGGAWTVELWDRRDDPAGGLYLPEAELVALRHLADSRPPDALTADRPPIGLVCGEGLGPFVPWLGGVRVLVGHRDHTPDYARTASALGRFLRTGEAAQPLRAAGVTHLLVGPRERPRVGRWVRESPDLELDWSGPGSYLMRFVGREGPRDSR